jgi:hypothetical protein
MRTGIAIVLGTFILAVVAFTETYINPPQHSHGMESVATTAQPQQ